MTDIKVLNLRQAPLMGPASIEEWSEALDEVKDFLLAGKVKKCVLVWEDGDENFTIHSQGNRVFWGYCSSLMNELFTNAPPAGTS